MSDMDLLEQLLSAQRQQSVVTESSNLNENSNTAVIQQTDMSENPEHRILVLKSGIAGVWYHASEKTEEGAKILADLVPGKEIKLERDYKNQHDQWAIALKTMDGKMIGYMSRYKNETIARLMDVGKSFRAFVGKPVAIDHEHERAVAPTENMKLPYSVYMIED